jgi:uncharacterized protein (TIRG00374 family)
MLGEVFNTVTPLGGMGGEPVKAALLKRHYRVSLHEGTASLIVAKTVNTLALVLFLAFGFWLVIDSGVISDSYKTTAGVGLAALGMGTFLFFLVQRFQVSSLTGSWIHRRRSGERLERLLRHIGDVDQRLADFYTKNRRRFIAAMTLAVLNWVLGVIEVYWTMRFLGHPITLEESWIIEAAAQLVRVGNFLIPASLGLQEGAFLLVTGAITGQPALGVAAAVVRRFREVLWLIWGALYGWAFAVSEPDAAPPPPEGAAGSR